MFVNYADDPVAERNTAPRCALTVAEYLAFQKDMHIPVSYTHLFVTVITLAYIYLIGR